MSVHSLIKDQGRCLILATLISFMASSVNVPSAMAQDLNLPPMPKPGVMVGLSGEFNPAHLAGITVHAGNALQFDFLIDKGEVPLDESQKQEEYKDLIKYFLASLTIPDKDQWVNLSPYEKSRIISEDFGKTEMGRDLLAQDYLLKQITSSLIYPEKGLGKKFWDKVYARAYQEYGATNIPLNTFNKVWILPDEAVVYEQGQNAYILKSHLKVMMEEDYLALQKNQNKESQPPTTNKLASQIIREIILPELEKEVNEGKNFARLRQIYSGMILATWYKQELRESLLGKIYMDKARVKGVDQDPKSNERIYQQYLQAFKKGVFNYIKEESDPYTQEVIPRKYFSGGFERGPAIRVLKNFSDIQGNPDLAMAANRFNKNKFEIAVSFVQPSARRDIKPKISINNMTEKQTRDALATQSTHKIRSDLSDQQSRVIGFDNDFILMVDYDVYHGESTITFQYAFLSLGALIVKTPTDMRYAQPIALLGLLKGRAVWKNEGDAAMQSTKTMVIFNDKVRTEELQQFTPQDIQSFITYFDQLIEHSSDPFFIDRDALISAGLTFNINQVKILLSHFQSVLSPGFVKGATYTDEESLLDWKIRVLFPVTHANVIALGKASLPESQDDQEISLHMALQSKILNSRPGSDLSEAAIEALQEIMDHMEGKASVDQVLERPEVVEMLISHTFERYHAMGVSSKSPRPDQSMATSAIKIATKRVDDVGGIDFNSAHLNMQIKKNGQGIPLAMDLQDWEQLKNVEGFVPVIIDIKPVVDLQVFNQLPEKTKTS